MGCDSVERNRQELGRLDGEIKLFLKGYQQNRNVASNQRRLLILFPGGMGSALQRATTPCNATIAAPSFGWDSFWLTLDVLFGHAVDHLTMTGDDDDQGQFLVPHGPIQSCLISPYDGFSAWCSSMQLDLFVFGYDWRRKPEHSVRFFLDDFFPYFLGRIAAENLRAPNDITLIGHSEGGMIVKLIAQDSSPVVANFTRFVTVGTPFYGFGGQTHRYFDGMTTYFPDRKSEITQIITSLQGGYFLHFLDAGTYAANQAALAADPDFPLSDYPSKDADDLTEFADAFLPTDRSGLFRYPQYINAARIADGLATYQNIAKDLPAGIAPKFYSFRGVQTRNGTARTNTVVSQTWARIDRPFDPDEAVFPFAFVGGAGDDTIPAWSARLISHERQYPDNAITLTGSLEHITLMEYSATQNQLHQLLFPQDIQPDTQVDEIIPVASWAEVAGFVKTLRAERSADRARSRIRTLSKEDSRRLGYGVMADLMGRMSPSDGEIHR